MPAIILSSEEVQALIAYNRKKITTLEEARIALKQDIKAFWNESNPNDLSIASEAAFICMNNCKDELRKIKKEIKMLAKLQYALKNNFLWG